MFQQEQQTGGEESAREGTWPKKVGEKNKEIFTAAAVTDADEKENKRVV